MHSGVAARNVLPGPAQARFVAVRVSALAQKAEYIWYDGQEGQPQKVRWAGAAVLMSLLRGPAPKMRPGGPNRPLPHLCMLRLFLRRTTRSSQCAAEQRCRFTCTPSAHRCRDAAWGQGSCALCTNSSIERDHVTSVPPLCIRFPNRWHPRPPCTPFAHPGLSLFSFDAASSPLRWALSLPHPPLPPSPQGAVFNEMRSKTKVLQKPVTSMNPKEFPGKCPSQQGGSAARSPRSAGRGLACQRPALQTARPGHRSEMTAFYACAPSLQSGPLTAPLPARPRATTLTASCGG